MTSGTIRYVEWSGCSVEGGLARVCEKTLYREDEAAVPRFWRPKMDSRMTPGKGLGLIG